MKRTSIQERGITLIALVITIIILLILAGVTISIVMNTGILGKSQTAADSYRYQQAKEQLDLAILDYKFAKMTGENTTFEKIISKIGEIVEHNEETGEYIVKIDGYEFEVSDPTIGGGTTKEPEATKYTLTITTESEKQGTVSGDNGKKSEGESCTVTATPEEYFEFDGWYEGSTKESVNETYTFNMPDRDYNLVAKFKTKVYPIGTYCTVNNEGFYTLDEYYANYEGSMTLLAAKNLDCSNLNDLKQGDGSVNSIAFSDTNYWWDEEEWDFISTDLNNLKTEVETDVINIAKKYGEKLNATKGRLLTVTEVEELGGWEGNTKYCPVFINLTSYWLGTAYNEYGDVWSVYGDISSLGIWNFSFDDLYGVRPVIEISKSKVSISD